MSFIDRANFYLYKYGKKLSKKLGQHLLLNPKYLNIEIKEAELSPNDVVLDIGAGMGFLTELLALKTSKVFAVEIDDIFARILTERLQTLINEDRIEIIHADFLKIRIPPITKIVSNPPYNIISEIILKILKEAFTQESFKLMVITVQDEFGVKLLSKPGSKKWGRISAAFRFFASGKIITRIPRYAFYPPPDVDSVIIKAWPNKQDHLVSFTIFEKTSSILFSHPNKKVRRILKNFLRQQKNVSWQKILSNIPNELLEKRVRQLSVLDIEKIGKILENDNLL